MKRVFFTYILSITLITSSLSYGQDVQLSDVFITASDISGSYIESNISQTNEINDLLTDTVAEMTTGSAVQLQESEVYENMPEGTDFAIEKEPADDNNPMEAQAVSAAAESITLSPSSFNMGNIPPDTAVTFSGAATLQISSKTNWTVRVSCPGFTSGGNAITAGRVKVKASSSSTYVTLSSSPQILMTGPKSWPRSSTYEIDYQITLLPSDPAGTDYLSNITYEISTN